jgi:hypothetical protein
MILTASAIPQGIAHFMKGLQELVPSENAPKLGKERVDCKSVEKTKRGAC